MISSVEKEVISIIADVSGIEEEEIGLDSNLFTDLDIDSIKAIEIAVALEKKFKVSIRDEEIPKITTPNQIIAITNKLLEQKGS